VITSSLYLGQFLSPVIAQPILIMSGITTLYTFIGIFAGVIALYLLLKQ